MLCILFNCKAIILVSDLKLNNNNNKSLSLIY